MTNNIHYFPRKSWQSHVINCLLRMFIKPIVAKWVNETSLPKLTDGIQRLRNILDKIVRLISKNVLTEEVYINDISAKWITPKNIQYHHIILYFHGGAFVIGSANLYKGFCAHLAKECACRILVINYHLTPEFPLKKAYEDALNAYGWLIKEGYQPKNIIVAGDSAGGTLVLSTLLKLKTNPLFKPKAAICLSPWTDLSLQVSRFANTVQNDPYIVLSKHFINFGDTDLTQATFSPLYAPVQDFDHFPPLLIQVSNIEILFSDSYYLLEKLRASNVDIVFEIWEEMPHCWQVLVSILPEAKAAIKNMSHFIKNIPMQDDADKYY